VRLCRVIGTVVASAHHPTYDGRKVLLVRPESARGESAGAGFVAVDRIQAGPHDLVLVTSEGNSVRQLLGEDAGPIRSIVVGIVDRVDVGA
jgi:microcompartment protein CcmK/EutM